MKTQQVSIFAPLALAALTAALTGCPPPAPAADAGDAGPVIVDTGVAADVREAAAPAPLFSPCTTAAQCGTGRTCNLAYSNGLCTRSCRRDTDCGDTGWCYQSSCIPQCSPGANECAPYSGLCFYWDAADTNKRGCFPGCSETPAMGEPACVAGRTCDPYSGQCETSPMVSGALNGAMCESASDCASGRCRLETTDTPAPGTPTGFLGGYCVSVTRRPASSAFVNGMPMPRGGCPMGSVVIPFRGEVEGDPVTCWKECRADTDCRAGYVCNRVTGTNGMPAYSTGGCYPINCRTAGMTCPAGTSCNVRMSGTSTIAVCARNDGDAGAGDAGSDASAAPDAAPDARPDAAPDALPDAAPDAAPDASDDAGLDGASDA